MNSKRREFLGKIGLIGLMGILLPRLITIRVDEFSRVSDVIEVGDYRIESSREGLTITTPSNARITITREGELLMG
mgnify:CR=1 FL=1